jgi:biopolymer transport protein ExbD
VKKVSKGHHGSLNELNITPLLDLAFVLLVIFIITTPQLSNNLEMNLPSAKKKEEAPKTPPKINRILVDVAGHVTFNGLAMELPALKQALFALKAGDAEASVVVRGAAEVDYQKIVGVLDLLQQAEIKVGLATETD